MKKRMAGRILALVLSAALPACTAGLPVLAGEDEITEDIEDDEDDTTEEDDDAGGPEESDSVTEDPGNGNGDPEPEDTDGAEPGDEDPTDTAEENSDDSETVEEPGDNDETEDPGSTEPGDADPTAETGGDADPEDAGETEEDDESEADESSLAQTEKTEEALEILSEIEELTGDYDITVEYVSVESDLEASFQTDEYSNTGGHIVGASDNYIAEESESSDTISVGSIADDGTETLRAEHTTQTTIILDESIKGEDLTVTVTDETGTIQEASEEEGTLIYDDIAGNVSEILDAVSTLSEELMALEADTGIDRTDQNNEIIDAASVGTEVVIAEVETVAGWSDGEDVIERISTQSGMKIYITEDQIVVINVTVSSDCTKVIMTQFTICLDGTAYSSAGQTDENSTLSNQIIFNFGDYDGEIYIESGVTGTIIAPNATVTVGSTSTGTVIAESFSNPGGEWHGSGTLTEETRPASGDEESEGNEEDTPQPEDEGGEPGPGSGGEDENDTPDDNDEPGDAPDGNSEPDDGNDTPDEEDVNPEPEDENDSGSEDEGSTSEEEEDSEEESSGDDGTEAEDDASEDEDDDSGEEETEEENSSDGEDNTSDEDTEDDADTETQSSTQESSPQGGSAEEEESSGEESEDEDEGSGTGMTPEESHDETLYEDESETGLTETKEYSEKDFSNIYKTGDSSAPGFWFLVLVLSVAALCAAVKVVRKN